MIETTYKIVPEAEYPLMETLEVNHSCGHVSKYAFGKGFAKINIDAGYFVIKPKCWHCNYKESGKRERRRTIATPQESRC